MKLFVMLVLFLTWHENKKCIAFFDQVLKIIIFIIIMDRDFQLSVNAELYNTNKEYFHFKYWCIIYLDRTKLNIAR